MSKLERKPVFPIPSALGRERVVVLGAGLAGLFTALKLAPMPVTVISPVKLGEGASSAWAQGGIAAAVAEGDSPEDHAADTIAAGGGIVDADIARLMAREAPERIDDLLRCGIPFDRDLEGHLSLSREAAHGRRRIVHVKGDRAGRAIMAALTQLVRDLPSIEVVEGWAATDVIVVEGRARGVRLQSADGREGVLKVGAVVLATGGAGQLFAVTTNPIEARAEGVGMAALAGAVIADAEFVQFHPTALNIGKDPAPLATEALRGRGAFLINANGHRFMLDAHKDAELGPRDIVARAVHREVTSGRGAFLDCRGIANFAEEFPTVWEACRSVGLDPRADPLPVAPAAHYHMGGVLTDASGRTTLNGLWACGEVASTGAHGANRLASNSLLEAVVFAARVAEDIAGRLPARRDDSSLTVAGGERGSARRADAALFLELRRIMSEHVAVIRSRDGLEQALGVIETLEGKAVADKTFRNSLAAAKLITVAALQRQESRGAHFRSDFPEPQSRFAKRSFLTLAEAEAVAAETLEGRSVPVALRA